MKSGGLFDVARRLAIHFIFVNSLACSLPKVDFSSILFRPLNAWFAWRWGQNCGTRFYFLCNLQHVTFRCNEKDNHDDKVAGGEKGGRTGISLLLHMAFFFLPSVKAKDYTEELECFVYAERTWQQTKEAAPVLLKSRWNTFEGSKKIIIKSKIKKKPSASAAAAVAAAQSSSKTSQLSLWPTSSPCCQMKESVTISKLQSLWCEKYLSRWFISLKTFSFFLEGGS